MASKRKDEVASDDDDDDEAPSTNALTSATTVTLAGARGAVTRSARGVSHPSGSTAAAAATAAATVGKIDATDDDDDDDDADTASLGDDEDEDATERDVDDDETTPSVSSVRPPPPPPPPPPPLPPAVTPGAEALEPWARRPASRAAAAVVDDTLLRAAREDGAADAAVAVAYDVVHTPEPKHPRGKRAAAAATAKAPPAAPSPPPPPPSATASARSAGSAAAANRADVQLLSELRDEVRQVKELREQQLEVLRQRTSAGPPPASARAAATTSVAVKSKTTSPPLPQSSTPTPPPLSKPPVAAMPVSPTWTSATESESEDDRHATPAASVRSQPAAQAPVQNQAPPVRVPEEPIAEPGAPVPSSSGASSSQESAGLSPTDMTRLHEHLASLDLRHLSHADIYRYLQFLSYAEDPISENWRLALIQVLESMDASRQPSAAPPVAGTSRTNGYESSGSPTASRVAHYLAYSEENSVPSDGSVPPTGQRPLTMADLEINVTPRRRGTTPTMSEVARLAYHRSRGGAVQAAVQQEVRRDLATAHQMMHRDASARRHARYRRSFPGAGSSPASNPVAPAPALHPHPPLSAAVAAAAATAASRNTESPEMVPREEIDALITLIRSTNEQVVPPVVFSQTTVTARQRFLARRHLRGRGLRAPRKQWTPGQLPQLHTPRSPRSVSPRSHPLSPVRNGSPRSPVGARASPFGARLMCSPSSRHGSPTSPMSPVSPPASAYSPRRSYLVCSPTSPYGYGGSSMVRLVPAFSADSAVQPPVLTQYHVPAKLARQPHASMSASFLDPVALGMLFPSVPVASAAPPGADRRAAGTTAGTDTSPPISPRKISDMLAGRTPPTPATTAVRPPVVGVGVATDSDAPVNLSPRDAAHVYELSQQRLTESREALRNILASPDSSRASSPRLTGATAAR